MRGGLTEMQRGLKERIIERIIDEIENRPGEYSLYFKDLNSGQKISIKKDRAFPAASIIKIPIMIEVFRQAETGRLNLDRLIRIPSQERVGGSVVIQELRNDIELSIKELTVLMIILSDNTATNILIDLLSMDKINSTINELGFKGTIIQRKMLDFEARKGGKENLTTVQDVGEMLGKIYAEEIPGVSGTMVAKIFRILSRQVYRDVLSLYIPEKYWNKIGSKTGTLPGHIHDASLFNFDQAQYVLVMMSGKLPENAVGKETGARISKLIFDSYTG